MATVAGQGASRGPAASPRAGEPAWAVFDREGHLSSLRIIRAKWYTQDARELGKGSHAKPDLNDDGHA